MMVRESNYEQDEEKLWRVRYVSKQDLERRDGSTPEPKNKFFYALDERVLQNRLAVWLRRVKHGDIIVQAIEQVPLGFNLPLIPGLLQELPQGARLLTLVEEALV
jgi:hypothetical protein